jgi:hypothetical protein
MIIHPHSMGLNATMFKKVGHKKETEGRKKTLYEL